MGNMSEKGERERKYEEMCSGKGTKGSGTHEYFSLSLSSLTFSLHILPVPFSFTKPALYSRANHPALSSYAHNPNSCLVSCPFSILHFFHSLCYFAIISFSIAQAHGQALKGNRKGNKRRKKAKEI